MKEAMTLIKSVPPVANNSPESGAGLYAHVILNAMMALCADTLLYLLESCELKQPALVDLRNLTVLLSTMYQMLSDGHDIKCSLFSQ